MFLRFDELDVTTFAGLRRTMTFADNRTGELWRAFMPRRGEIPRCADAALYSIEVYPPEFFEPFDPRAPFEKWAAVKIPHRDAAPEGMATLIAPAGRYAVFLHCGPAADGPRTYAYIFETWLPASCVALDQRPHFAVMGERYRNDDPASEEEIWIPVRSA